MAGAANSNTCGKIEEPIAVNVPNFDTATMRHDERMLPRIGGRYDISMTGKVCPRLGAGQFSGDRGMTIGMLSHLVDFACSNSGRGVFVSLRASRACGIFVRL